LREIASKDSPISALIPENKSNEYYCASKDC
jgi:hypothetical protein